MKTMLKIAGGILLAILIIAVIKILFVIAIVIAAGAGNP